MGVEHSVGVPDDDGEQPKAGKEPQNTPEYRGKEGVQKVFSGDFELPVAERAESTNLGPVLLDHAGHSGQADECGDKEKEDGEDAADCGHPVDVLREADKARVFLPVEHHPARLFERTDFGLCVADLGLGLCDLLVKSTAALLELRASCFKFALAL